MMSDEMQSAVDNILEDLIGFSRSESELIIAEVIKVKLVDESVIAPVGELQ